MLAENIILRQQVLISEYTESPLPLFPNILIESSIPLPMITEHLMFDKITYWANSVIPCNVSTYVVDISKKKNPFKHVKYDILSLNTPRSLADLASTVSQLYAKEWLAPIVLLSAIIPEPSTQEIAELLTLPMHSVQPSLQIHEAIRHVIPNVTLLEAPNTEEVEFMTYHTIMLIKKELK